MTPPGIHPTAIVSAGAILGERVSVGPFAIIGDGCEVGDECSIHARATLEQDVKLAARVTVGIGSVLGGQPQDLKYAGEHTTVEIGEGTVIREFVTINRGTSHSFKTTVGSGSLLMSYVHLAHDCHIGNGVIIGNSAQLAGHVTIEDKATLSGLSGVHQFVRIGRNAFIGGCSRVSKDIPPFLKAVGNPVRLYGLNSIGLQRSGFSDEVVRELKRAYRLLFRSDLNLSQAIQRVESDLEQFSEVRELVQFVEASGRGIVI
ncbi:MAG: acyl-ACP--UDP-N-acetylglucosamine O-acyltransferase [Gemmatimonadaceae bacterium]